MPGKAARPDDAKGAEMGSRQRLIAPVCAVALLILGGVAMLAPRNPALPRAAAAGRPLQGTPTPICTPGWAVVTSPNASSGHNSLSGVAVLGAADAWAVGSYRDAANRDQPLILHWNGAAWTVV